MKLPQPLTVKTPDEDLVEACLRGNQQAWSVLVDKYKNLVYSVPSKYRMSPQDAADVFQAVWCEVSTELGKLRQVGALRSWLITMTSRKCLQVKRNGLLQNARAEEEIVDPAAESDLAIRQELEREQIMREAQAQLPERCRVLVDMLFFQDPPLSYKAAADRLGLAEGSIGFIRGRCLQKLKRILEDSGF
jgi:RNA polymerase sigma factor (sigma-70 family)